MARTSLQEEWKRTKDGDPRGVIRCHTCTKMWLYRASWLWRQEIQKGCADLENARAGAGGHDIQEQLRNIKGGAKRRKIVGGTCLLMDQRDPRPARVGRKKSWRMPEHEDTDGADVGDEPSSGSRRIEQRQATLRHGVGAPHASCRNGTDGASNKEGTPWTAGDRFLLGVGLPSRAGPRMTAIAGVIYSVHALCPRWLYI